MVEKFLCPGCVCGSDTKCGKYKTNSDPGAFNCEGHVLGTIIMPAPGNIALGMPKGFNRPGYCQMNKRTHNQMNIRLWPSRTLEEGGAVYPDWNDFNIPVWVLDGQGDDAGFLFVRTAMPRVSGWIVDVIEGGLAMNVARGSTDMTPHYGTYD